MKYILILGDGMAGEPLEALGGRTTLDAARTPAMDALASMGSLGMVRTVPEGMKPGSDVANLSVLGYDPRRCYTGRSPLEALSLGLDMGPEDVSFRCNLVTLSSDSPFPEKILLDHSAGEISTQDAAALIRTVQQTFGTPALRFFPGTSYRHIALWQGGQVLELEAPHDHLGQKIRPYLPQHALFRQISEESFQLLDRHSLNLDRVRRGLNKANALWFWGAGTRPALPFFQERTGLRATMISAVDLLKGLAVATGIAAAQVEGATGGLDTNYEGKAQAALHALLDQGQDLAYIHVEAPDEMGHQGQIRKKIQAIEDLDRRIVAPIKAAMDQSGQPYRIMVLPDHPTPIRARTHTGQPVPYLIFDSRRQRRRLARYTEAEAAATGTFLPEGHRLMDLFLDR